MVLLGITAILGAFIPLLHIEATTGLIDALVAHTARILFLEDGRLVESGTHAALMEQGGRYARMFSIQAGWYR
jgi:hypothetical protein